MNLLNSPARSAPAPAPRRRHRVTYLAGAEERSVVIESRDRPAIGPDGWIEFGGIRYNGAHVLAIQELPAEE